MGERGLDYPKIAEKAIAMGIFAAGAAAAMGLPSAELGKTVGSLEAIRGAVADREVEV